MGKVLVQMMLTLDGFISGPNGELDWVDNDPEMGKYHSALAQNASAGLMGRNLYDAMAGFWPAMATDPNAPANEAAFAKIMNDMPKIVFSGQPGDASWSNTTRYEVANDADVAKKVQALKQASDKHIVVYGGVKLVQTLMRLNLVDEYRFDVCPVVLGTGTPLFTERHDLELIESVPYASGAVTMAYRSKTLEQSN